MFKNIEDIELYLIAFLVFFIVWLIANTVKYYRGEKRKVKHLHRFAKEDDSDAQYLLAQRYRKGMMVKRSCQNAAFWYQKAAYAGNSDAEGFLAKILRKKRC
jgi:TPR repeat protein